jgi:hypothetical protein
MVEKPNEIQKANIQYGGNIQADQKLITAEL